MTAVLYDIISILPISMAAALFCRPILSGEVTSVLLYPVTIILSLLCILFYHLKTRGRIVLAGITAALTAGLAIGQKTAAEKYIWILPVFLICVLSFVAGKIANRYIKVKAGIAVLALVTLIVLMITQTKEVKGVFVALCFYIILSIVELIQSMWTKEGDPGIRAHVVYTLPFILAVMIPLLLFSSPARPYDWSFFKNLAKNIRVGFELLIQSFSSEDGWDGGDTFGFSDKGSIGGSVSGDPYTVLTLSSDTQNDYRIYLSGKTFDTFDKNEWKKTDESDIDEAGFDSLETISAIEAYDGEHASDYLKQIRLRVKYEGIRTRHLFVPAKSIPKSSSTDAIQKGGDILTKGRKKQDFTIRYYRINRDGDDFTKLLESGINVSKEDRLRAIEKYPEMAMDNYSEEGLEAYQKLIEEKYDTPVKLSERSQELLDELLDGAHSDAQKLERIEEYLTTFKYTRNPGNIPENITSQEDFLDWFLFEKKQGFCTHFATVFVLLARSQGIPARYVQGYSTLSRALKYDVTSDRTHAWPEAYIKGVGWIGYEPTPGYRQTRGWAVSSEKAAANAAAGYHSTYEGDHNANEPDDPEKKESDTKISKVLAVLGSRWVKIMAAFIAVFLILFFAADQMLRRYRYRQMSDTGKIRQLCRRNLKMLKKAGFGIAPGETLAEYKERVSRDVPEGALSFVEIYEQVLYSSQNDFSKEVSLTEESAAMVKSFVYGAILRRLRPFQKNIEKFQN